MAATAGADAAWWNAAWTARRALTFNNSGQAEHLVGFPVLVRLDATRIDYSKVQPLGQDLRFVDADNLTVLAHEIESWNAGGTSWVWVRVPQIDSLSTTDFIYMYYGNPVAADGQNVAGTWDSGFTLVMHLDETAGAHQDSATNPIANNSASVSVAAQGSATGQVNGADQFGGSHFVRVADHASLNMTDSDSFSVEAWIRTSATGWRAIVSKENATDMQYQLWLNDIGAGDSRLNFWLVGAGGAQQAQVQGTTDLSDNLFHYVVGRWDNAAGRAEIFVDGASQGSFVNASLGDLTSTSGLHIGQEGDGNGGGEWNGILDEVRISKTARSNAWIRAQNLSMRDAFITFGPEPQYRFGNVTGGCGLGGPRSPLDKVSQRKIVRDKDGNRYLVFGRFRDTGACVGFQEIVLARSTDDGATWTEAKIFGQGGIAWNDAAAGFLYAALDTNAARDQLHVVVQHIVGQRLLYTKNTSLANWDQAASWTCAAGGRNSGGACIYDGAEQLNTASVYQNTAPAIAVDADGLPHVAYEAFQGSGSNRAVRWRFYRPGFGSWSPEVLVSNDVCTSGNRDVSIEASTGLNASSVVQSRVHFLYKQDADCMNTVDTLRYAYAVRTAAETYSAVTNLPGTGAGSPFNYLWISNGTGAARVAQGASLAAQNGRLWAVGGFDSGGTAQVKMAFSTTNGDTWDVGAASGVAVGGATSDEGYPAVGANAGYEHRIMSGRSLTGTSSQQGYQWLERSRAFRFRTQLQGDATAGEANDYAHLTLEKRRPVRSSDFAYCWYVSTNNGAPPPNLLLDEIRCNVEPSVMYRSIADVSPSNTYAVGTVSATNGSRTVTGAGTAWKTANRGRGDRIDIDGTNYIVEDVTLQNELRLTRPYLGTTGAGKPYTLARQFTTLGNWETCVDGPGGTACPFFPVTSSSLISDNRIEVGIGYDDGGGAFAQGATISGSTTDFVHNVTLTVAPGNRHSGVAGTGVRISAAVPTPIFDISDRNVTLEWMSLASGGATANGAIRINVNDPNLNGPVVVRNNVVVGPGSHGILVGTTASQNIVLDIHSNVIRPVNLDAYYGIRLSPSGGAWGIGADVYVSNNTLYPDNSLINDYGILADPASNAQVTLVNNIAHSWDIECIQVPNPSPFSDYNLVGPRPGDTDGSCTTAPGGSSLVNVPLSGAGGVNFVNPGPGGNFHLLSTSVAIDQATTLAGTHLIDIDGGARPKGAAWDIGADEEGATTAVRLLSFEAAGADGAVLLSWRTGAEVNNLGFHLHRSQSADGPWARSTSSLIPGQGFSATGASYSWRDFGLVNGVRYHYRLEDVDSKTGSTFHGPVSAVAQLGPGSAQGEGEGSGSGSDSKDEAGSKAAFSCPAWALAQLGASASSYTCETHGDPFATSFEVVKQTSRRALVELRTGGFVAARDGTGRVRALIPGFETLKRPRDPALPLKRALLEGVVARRGRIHSVEGMQLESFPGLVPAAVGYPQAMVRADGTVRAGRREARLRALTNGVVPRVMAELERESFQGERKKLSLELLPLRYDAALGGLVLARRLRVGIEFTEREPRERGQGRIGRRKPRAGPALQANAFLATTQKGLHAATFEQLFPGGRRGIDVGSLRLSRNRGERVVPFHVEPQGKLFGPGSRLYFHSDSVASSVAFSPEVVYALESGPGGVRMGIIPGATDGSAVVGSRGHAEWETNRFFAPDVLETSDLWQWEAILGGGSKTKAFALEGLDPSSPEPARLVVHLQGGSDAGDVVDHHVQLLVNGALVAEGRFGGAVPWQLEADVPLSLLQADANELVILNVGDTGVYSRVLLDRFEITYPQAGAARAGSFEGAFSSGGAAEVTGLAAPAAVLDLTRSAWLTGLGTGPSLRFVAEAGHAYLAVSQEALVAPRVFFPEATSRLKNTQAQADYVLVAPQAFLAAAEPLLAQRQAQGLTTFAASLEEIALAFGGGEPSAQAIKDFVSFAYHSWQSPSPRYVMLLGDANYDPRRFNANSQPSPLPYLLERTSYLWTASDPALGAVNGEDLLPDLAIGRLPATTVEQARALVAKILDWESQGQALDGPVALVADNADLAGDFEANQRDIEASFLAGRETRRIFLAELGSASLAKGEILHALDGGLSLLSYVGHGGGSVWASENMLSSYDTPSLQAQPRQPLMLTMNCLNGYFVTPFYESLAEAFLKVEGRGTIGSFSPSGLSLDAPAHLYQRALMAELTSGRHLRLGDAILAAQRAYADTGAMPELLAIYHLFADPAMKIQ